MFCKRERERELFDQPETRPTVGNQPSKDYLDGDDEHWIVIIDWLNLFSKVQKAKTKIQLIMALNHVLWVG